MNAVCNKDHPSSAMIVPTRGGSAGIDAEVLLKRWGGQSWLPDELIIVRGASNPAAARNVGAASTPADILIFVDDDARPFNDHTIESIVGALIYDEMVWLSGAAIQLPPDSSRFRKAYARQIPRNKLDIPLDTTESNFATTLCCAVRRVHFNSLKGFDERLVAGEDPEFRDRLRRAGGRIVLAGGAGVLHSPPDMLGALWRRGNWYGRGEAQVARLFRGERWRRETKSKSLSYILIKAILSPTCLVLNWESLRIGKIRLDFQPLRLVHIWAVTVGYITGRFLTGGNIVSEGTAVVEKLKISPVCNPKSKRQ